MNVRSLLIALVTAAALVGAFFIGAAASEKLMLSPLAGLVGVEPADAGSAAKTDVHGLRELQDMDVKLAGGRQALVSVALELETGGREPATDDGERARSVITRVLAGTPASDLLDERRRRALKQRLRRELRRETRLPIARVLLPDFVVSSATRAGRVYARPRSLSLRLSCSGGHADLLSDRARRNLICGEVRSCEAPARTYV